MRRLIPLLAIAAVTAACGHSSAPRQASGPQVTTAPSSTSTSTSTSTAVTTTEATTSLRIYLLRDGRVAPVRRDVPATAEVATAVLRELADGPTTSDRADHLTTAYPGSDPVRQVTVDSAGVATVELAQTLSHAALAQLVYTLTQFATVHSVRTSRMIAGAGPLTRATFEDVTPQILVESPLPGDTVTSPLRVRGTANTFEATLDLAVLNSSGVRIAWRFVTATSGSGTRGTFDATISFPRTGGPLTLVAYEPSAENGKPIHEVRIPLGEG